VNATVKFSIPRYPRAAARAVLSDLPLPALEFLTGRRVVAPCYHLVADQNPVHIKHLYTPQNARMFRAQLDWLLSRYSPVSLADVKCGKCPPRSMFLSFDDGLREVNDVVAPICLSKGIPATFFVSPGFLDNRQLCFRHKASILVEICEKYGSGRSRAALGAVKEVRGALQAGSTDFRAFFLSLGFSERHILDQCAAALEIDFSVYLEKVQPYLTTEQLGKLVRQGFSIGGHSLDHPLYSDLSLNDQLFQTSQCLEQLDQFMSPGLRSFAFPFVSDGVSSEFFAQVFAKNILDSVFCIGGVPNEWRERVIHRFPAEGRGITPLRDSLKSHLTSALHFRIRQSLS
jgi:peptidoglycan/xylan/chitin deacetylase (PgdA/CDA1 family)